MSTVYIFSEPTARKKHQCCECRGNILAGEKYTKHNGVSDGSGFTYKMCAECWTLFQEIDDLARKENREDEDRVHFSMLYEHVFESENPKWIKRYLTNAKNRAAKIEDWMQKKLDNLPVHD